MYRTSDGFVYIAVGNDKQWGALTGLDGFGHLAKDEYKKNAGRIGDVNSLNDELNRIFSTMTTNEAIQKLNSIGVAVSKINSIEEVMADPLVKDNLLSAEDAKSGTKLTLAPPPYRTDFLEEIGGRLKFPPRFGEHNQSIYSGELGRSTDELAAFKEKGVI